MLRAALWWAKRGVAVFPVWAPRGRICSCPKGTFCNSAGKHPMTEHGWKDGTTDPATITIWWTRWPDANLAIVTGAGSGILVLDVDPGHGGDDTLREIEAKDGAVPHTWRFLTGGGEHVVLKHPGGTIDGGIGKLGPGLDVWADTTLHYVIVPPSLHRSGRRYCSSVDHHPGDTPLADMPAWLLERLRPEAKTAEAKAPRPPEFWADLVTSDVPEGKRNATIAQLAGHLLSRVYGHDPYFAMEIVQMFNAKHCKPPLDDDEVAAVVRSISAAEEKKIHVLKAGSR
jgi:hypothetical protein